MALIYKVSFLREGRTGCRAIAAQSIEPPQLRLFVVLLGYVLLPGTGLPWISAFRPRGCISSPAKGIQTTGDEMLARSPLCNTSGHFWGTQVLPPATPAVIGLLEPHRDPHKGPHE